MVSSITKLVLIGVGLAVVAGLAFIQYQYTTSDTLGGQLSRSRFGLDEDVPLRSVLNKEADPSKPLSQQPKDKLHELVDKIIANITGSGSSNRDKYIDGVLQLPPINITTKPTTTPTSRANATFIQQQQQQHSNLSAEEERYEPWAL